MTLGLGSRIRLATPDDARAIASIQIDGWRTAYRGVVPDTILDGFQLDPRSDRWAAIIETSVADGTGVWVVTADEEAGPVLGFAMAGPGRDESAPPPDGAGEVYAIYVDPAAIGQGHGRALFGHAVAGLGARGFDPIVVWVLEANPRGRHFYEAAGFLADGARNTIDFDGTPVDEIRYRFERG